jgi:hypothetical protein
MGHSTRERTIRAVRSDIFDLLRARHLFTCQARVTHSNVQGTLLYQLPT